MTDLFVVAAIIFLIYSAGHQRDQIHEIQTKLDAITVEIRK